MKLFFLLWSVQVFAAFNLTWGSPALSLDTNPPLGDTDNNTHIAMDQEGNAVATWSRTMGMQATESIWAATFNASHRTWTGALKISGTASASNSQTVIDSEGNAIFIWEEGFPTRICYRMLSNEGVWTPDLTSAATVVRVSKNAQSFPQITIDPQGNALAIWTEFFGGKHHLFSSKKPKNSSWSDLGEIASGLQDVHLISGKALVTNQFGNGVAIWEEANKEIYLACFIDGKWFPALLITDQNASSPSAGIDEKNDVVIVWSQNGAIYSKTIQNGLLSQSSLLVSDPEYLAERPALGMDSNGNATVIFERYNPMHKFIAAAHLNKGALNWTKPTDISGPSPLEREAAGYPVLAMNTIGDGVAIWKEWTGENMVIQGAGFSIGTWSSIKTLSSLMGNAGSFIPSYDISVALNQAGHILAIWPEDPLKTGSQQIKVSAAKSIPIPSAPQIQSITGIGLANTGPLPPLVVPSSVMQGIVTGKQVLHKFPAHSDLINILNWESPGNIACFHVYRGSLAHRIASPKEPKYEDHQRTPKEQVLYLITSVDRFGQESSPITLVVNPL